MIAVPTAWWAHYIGDVAAWSCAALAARWQYRRWPEESRALASITSPSYFVALALGALAGAWLFGSANSLRSLLAAPSHSVAGALAGGIVAVELWKWRRGVRSSTGGAFVLPLAVGIAAGRLGCLFSGLPDFTYGTPTALPWAVDIGDGVPRHPVQVYESLAMGRIRGRLCRGTQARCGLGNAPCFPCAGDRLCCTAFRVGVHEALSKRGRGPSMSSTC